MKFIIVAACVSMVVFATANDLSVGQREDGDELVASRRLRRIGIPLIPGVAQTGYNTDGRVTAVTAVNGVGSNATVKIIKGGPGNSSVVLRAVSAPGTGLDVQVDIYAIRLSTSPPPPPPTTLPPTTTA